MKNALLLAYDYYEKAGRSPADLAHDAAFQDVAVLRPELVLLARRVNSAAPFIHIVNVRHTFDPQVCDAWHLHFLAGDVRLLLRLRREICSLPWILTQHGKRGDGRLMRLSTARFCRILGARGGGVYGA